MRPPTFTSVSSLNLDRSSKLISLNFFSPLSKSRCLLVVVAPYCTYSGFLMSCRTVSAQGGTALSRTRLILCRLLLVSTGENAGEG